MKNLLTITLLTFFIGLSLVFPNVGIASENWSMYNHDSGLTGKTGQFVLGPVTLKWKEQLTTGVHVRSQTIAVDGRLYVATVDGQVIAYDISTGQKYWTANTGGRVFGSPLVVASRVVVPVYFGDKGELQGYDLNGTKKWTVQAAEPFFASPIFHRGAIFIGGIDQKLYSVDPEDGVKLWTKDLSGRVLGAVAAKNGTIVVQTDDFKGYAFDINGNLKWTVNLPGEVVRDTNPMIGKNTVLFTTGAKARDMNAIEGQPYYRDTPLQTDWTGSPSLYNPPEGILGAAQTEYNQNPREQTMYAADLTTGAEKFKVSLPTPYWGSLVPIMLTDTLAFKQAHAATWSINMDTGETKLLDFKLFRIDEYTYSSMGGGQREYGGAADYLGLIDHVAKTQTDLVRTPWTHYVPDWQYPPDNNNKYMFIPGPGDGNTGYVTTPVIYENKIAWVGDGSWLQVHQGTGNNEKPDTQTPSVPANVRNNSSSGTTAKLIWDASSDNIGITGYKIYRNNVLIGETDATSFDDVNLASNTAYQFSVTSLDALNNESGKSSTVQITTGTGTGTPAPTPTPTACQEADINQDNFVDITDFGFISGNFFKTSNFTNPRADINGDGIVDLGDFSLLALQFFKTCP